MLRDGPSMPLRLSRACFVNRSFVPALAAAAALVSVVLAAPVAHAQTTSAIMITIPLAATMPTSLERLDKDHKQVDKRSQALNPEAVNLQDCHDDQFIRFPLVISGTGAYTGEVWATEGASNCGTAVARQTGTGQSGQCYRLSPSFIITPNQNVDVSVKEVIKGLGTQTLDSNGCRETAQTSITVWFLILSGSGSDAVQSAMVPVTVATKGPDPLTGVEAKPGDTRINVTWATVGEGGSTNVLGVQAYCDTNPSAAGATDAGTHQVCDDAEAAAADSEAAAPEPNCTSVANSSGGAGAPIPAMGSIGSPGASCTTAHFTAADGKPFVPDSKLNDYKCGDITGQGNTITINSVNGVPLANGTTYAVAVAATDTFGNLGKLSTPVCQFPEQTSDFWHDYRGAGGESGGGFCSIDGAGMPAGSLGLFMVGLVISVASVRRALLRRRNGR